jgi:Flp pilus assembly pilin Flp
MTPSVRVHSRSERFQVERFNTKQPRSKTTMKKVMNFINDESGIETLEYAIIAAIVAAVALLVYGSGWGGSIRNTLINAAKSSTTATL